MSLFQFLWLRKLIRGHTKPIPELKAHKYKSRLSLAYMFFAWNAFGFVCYMVFSGKADWAKQFKTKEELNLTPAQQWSKTLGIKEAKVYRIQGFQVQEYDIRNDEENKESVETKTLT